MYIPLTFEGSQAKCLFASGGYEGYFISGSQQYKYHWFTGSADLVVQKGTIDNVQIYVVGGGGGGGSRDVFTGGGGGGGGGVNYTMTGRLFQGGYAVNVGAGGTRGSTQSSDGTSGISSSFIGTNVNMIAGGGGGGSGVTSAGGTGGTPNGGNGGSGGTNVGANGQIGVLIYFAGEAAAGFGCGGGGAKKAGSGGTSGFSCNDTSYGGAPGGSGANRYGMGGAGGNGPGNRLGGNGGSGSVMIQYPINDYCSNYFNETGSCGCRQITFDTTDALNYYPDITGSYIYMPCGESKFVSGSLISYGPLTVCAVSNSYFSYTIGDAVDPIVVSVQQGFVTTGPECVSASLVPLPCTFENFVPTCTSSIVTIYTPSSSVGDPANFGYVAKNETTHSIYTSTSARVKYLCISTGSVYAGNQIYPQLFTTGNYPSLFSTASCNNVTFTSAAAFPANRFYSYYNCNGAYTNGSFNGPGSATRCVDTTAPFGFVATSQIGTSVTIGGNCLSGSFDTASCGCP